MELAAGTVEYEDTGGDGPVIVLLHGVGMNGSLWRGVVADLRPDHRCVVPTLPLGGQLGTRISRTRGYFDEICHMIMPVTEG